MSRVFRQTNYSSSIYVSPRLSLFLAPAKFRRIAEFDDSEIILYVLDESNRRDYAHVVQLHRPRPSSRPIILRSRMFFVEAPHVRGSIAVVTKPLLAQKTLEESQLEVDVGDVKRHVLRALENPSAFHALLVEVLVVVRRFLPRQKCDVAELTRGRSLLVAWKWGVVFGKRDLVGFVFDFFRLVRAGRAFLSLRWVGVRKFTKPASVRDDMR